MKRVDETSGDPWEGAPPDGGVPELLPTGRKAGEGQDEAREVRMIRAPRTAVVSTTVINSPPPLSMSSELIIAAPVTITPSVAPAPLSRYVGDAPGSRGPASSE